MIEDFNKVSSRHKRTDTHVNSETVAALREGSGPRPHPDQDAICD